MATGRFVEVYLDLLSQPCRAVHILLACAKVPHRVRTVALRKGEHRTPEFTKLNPMQKVPVMVDNGFVLTESDAILKYLANRYDVPEHWYPRQPERRARVDEYTAWHHTNTRPHAAKVFFLEVLAPRMSGSPVDEDRLSRALSDLSTTLDLLQSMFLRRQPFLCGDDITVADLLAVCELMQPLGGGRDVLRDRPQLQRWRSRVQSAVGESFDAAHAVVYALRDRSKAKL
ncbi:glutathione S-transferase theta-2 [Myripristis murdjan]|uniref:glutathione transferase n=1 Tax=Myripristis murdjan TaxID=586833 RepID=A0A667XCR6_9TELE|nr:glutathione S-transferase theta-1-like [Myripristis murdjan]XP_029915416.1 glutathione S-transferase theta-1-like [Myripristis murdjan]